MEKKENHQEEVKDLLMKLKDSPIVDESYYYCMLYLCRAGKEIVNSIYADATLIEKYSKENESVSICTKQICDKVNQMHYILDVVEKKADESNFDDLFSLIHRFKELQGISPMSIVNK